MKKKCFVCQIHFFNLPSTLRVTSSYVVMYGHTDKVNSRNSNSFSIQYEQNNKNNELDTALCTTIANRFQ